MGDTNKIESWLLDLVPDGWMLTKPGSGIRTSYPYRLENWREVWYFQSRRDVISWLCKKGYVAEEMMKKLKYNPYRVIRSNMFYRTEEERKQYLENNKKSN